MITSKRFDHFYHSCFPKWNEWIRSINGWWPIHVVWKKYPRNMPYILPHAAVYFPYWPIALPYPRLQTDTTLCADPSRDSYQTGVTFTEFGVQHKGQWPTTSIQSLPPRLMIILLSSIREKLMVCASCRLPMTTIIWHLKEGLKSVGGCIITYWQSLGHLISQEYHGIGWKCMNYVNQRPGSFEVRDLRHLSSVSTDCVLFTAHWVWNCISSCPFSIPLGSRDIKEEGEIPCSWEDFPV